MHDGLLELLISYQVIHWLRDLFALRDRPQVKGRWKAPDDQIALLMLESLSLLGHFALLHPENQVVLQWGKSSTLTTLHMILHL